MSDTVSRLQIALAGRYRVERELGRGGMGVVYLAHDLRHDRDVVIKVLLSEAGTPDGNERFLAEVRTTARLQHPHIVPLLDSGDVGGQPFFVMPYVRGESLRLRLSREKRLPVEEALHIAGEVGDALAHAHRAGFIHRDVKPENVLLSEGHALLADFGVACSVAPDSTTAITGTGLVVGTVTYMSPEQASGARDIGPSVDQYALGCIVYEMLAGEPPFSGPTIEATLVMRMTAEPMALHLLRPDVPAGVEAAVHKALARDSAERHASVAAFIGALAAPGGTAVPTARPEASIAVLPFANLSADPENEYFSDGVTEEIIGRLSKISALKVISRTSVMRFRHPTQGLREIARTLGVATVLEGSVRRAGERLRITAQLIDARTDEHLWSESYDRHLIDVFEIQSDVAQRIAEALRARLTPEERAQVVSLVTTDIDTFNLTLLGRHYLHWATEEGCHKAVACFDQAIARDAAYAPAHAGRGCALGLLSLGYFSVSGGAFRDQAERALERALQLDASLADARAWSAMLVMQYDHAWERAQAILQRTFEIDPNCASARDLYGNLLAATGCHREAARQFELAIELDPLSYLITGNAALCAHRAREFEKADRLFARQIDLNPELPMAHALRTMTAMQLGQPDAALAAARKAVAIHPDHPTDLFLAAPLAASGARPEAIAILGRSEAARATKNVWLVGLALAYAQLGETDLALSRLEQAYEARDFWMLWLKVQPELDPLRAEPRFEQLVRKVHLE